MTASLVSCWSKSLGGCEGLQRRLSVALSGALGDAARWSGGVLRGLGHRSFGRGVQQGREDHVLTLLATVVLNGLAKLVSDGGQERGDSCPLRLGWQRVGYVRKYPRQAAILGRVCWSTSRNRCGERCTRVSSMDRDLNRIHLCKRKDGQTQCWNACNTSKASASVPPHCCSHDGGLVAKTDSQNVSVPLMPLCWGV